MAGKFMNRNAIINTIKSQERVNAQQKRDGTNFHVEAVVCQCSDPDCGAFHRIDTERPLPSRAESEKAIKQHKKRKPQ